MTHRIALCGLAGSGKSTAADYLVHQHGFKRLSYATPIKRMFRALLLEAGLGFGEVVEIVDGARKEEPLDVMGGVSARRALQTLGTEWGRDMIRPDLWRSILLRKVASYGASPIVVDDCRFADEADSLHDAGFLIVRIKRTQSGTDSLHISECQDFGVDKVLDNNGTPADLATAIDSLLAL